MANLDSMSAVWAPRALSILRIITAFLFMAHGTQKLFDFPAPPGFPFELVSLIGVAAILEVFGGFLALIGLFTRPVAFILSGQMAFAYFIAHAPSNFWPVLNGGESAVLFCFIFLYLSLAGGGPWSVDSQRGGATSVT